jgi:phospholipase/carboxylesterase
MTGPLAFCTYSSAPAPSWTVIWLHGLGADGSDFLPIVAELPLPASPGIRFVFPHAPVIPVTCNGGYPMPAWYDILSLAPHAREIDVAGLQRSCARVRQLIAAENANGIPCERIVLAGFSQGGAVAYTAGLTHPYKLAGIVALSTYLPAPALIEASDTTANRDTPVFIAHGDDDSVVAPLLGQQARDWLAARGQPLAWHCYPMEHEVCHPEIDDLGRWFSALLGGTHA